MANVTKQDAGKAQGAQPQSAQPQVNQPQVKQPQVSQPQSAQPQVHQPQAQRGELVQRSPWQQLARDPFDLFMRDPFQLMREMMTNPFRMFSLSPWGGMGRDAGWNPQFEVRETEDAFVFKADVPGIRDEDLEITLTGNQLQISGKREYEQEQNEGRFHTFERSYGSFSRSFQLPESADLDNIRSDLKGGELTLVVPKQPGASPQRRKIQVGSGAKS
jgi:HSP20 family protein